MMYPSVVGGDDHKHLQVTVLMEIVSLPLEAEVLNFLANKQLRLEFCDSHFLSPHKSFFARSLFLFYSASIFILYQSIGRQITLSFTLPIELPQSVIVAPTASHCLNK